VCQWTKKVREELRTSLTPTNREEQDNEDADIISPIFEQQIIEKDEDANLISLVFKQQVTEKDEDATIISPVFEKQVT
jgi:hypothetical protein